MCGLAGSVLLVVLCVASLLESAALAQGRRKVIIDQDAAGPGGTDMQAIAALVSSPAAEVLGICVPHP
jgi:hypothetical protein